MKLEYNTFYYEEKDGIGEIVIQNPPGNVTTALLIDEFIDLNNEIHLRCKLKGLILKGQGRHFSSGADVEELLGRMSAMSIYSKEGQVLSYPSWFIKNRMALNSLYCKDIPVISCVNGFCIGSGLEFALMGHIRICGKKCTIGFPESTFGLLPGATGTLRSVEEMGLGRSIELILSGDLIHCEEALSFNLFHKSVEKKELYPYVEKLMSFILSRKEKYSRHTPLKYIMEFEQYL